MMMRHIDYLFHDNPYSLHKCFRKSLDWILDELKDLELEYGAQIWNVGRLLHARQCNGSNCLTNVIVPGNFYTFLYKPLSRYVLPYYDIFPLVLVFQAENGWFRGLNLHHLPQQTRIQLVGHLMNYATTISPMTGEPTLTDQTRILFDWDEIKDSPAGAFMQPIEQKYLMNRAKGGFKYIDPRHWALMLMLPCEQFVKADKDDVWRDTVRKAKENYKEHWERKGYQVMDFEKMLENTISSIQQGDGGAITRK